MVTTNTGTAVPASTRTTDALTQMPDTRNEVRGIAAVHPAFMTAEALAIKDVGTTRRSSTETAVFASPTDTPKSRLAVKRTG